ncbi:MAG: hypothetical protein AAB392_00960 [Patescibacteria group bacterium]
MDKFLVLFMIALVFIIGLLLYIYNPESEEYIIDGNSPNSTSPNI